VGGGAAHDERDFLVSYVPSDRGWAKWIGWVLEDAGFRIVLQAWDFVPGSNWVSQLHGGVSRARRTVAVLSGEYAESEYWQAVWQAAWQQDPSGEDRKLLVVRVEDCPQPGLLKQIRAPLRGARHSAAHAAHGQDPTGRHSTGPRLASLVTAGRVGSATSPRASERRPVASTRVHPLSIRPTGPSVWRWSMRPSET
jgi:hypothetical protein